MNPQPTILATILILLAFFCPVFAQDVPPDPALRIAELEKEKAELQNQNLELRIKLESVDYEKLNLKLRRDIWDWATNRTAWVLGIVSVVLIAGGGLLISLLVENRVAKSIAGEKAKFDKMVQQVQTAQQEIESTKQQIVNMADEMKQIRYQMICSFLTTGVTFPKDLAQHLPPDVVLKALENEKPSGALEQSAIKILGYQRHEPAIEAITESMRSSEHWGTKDMAIQSLARIGTRKSDANIIRYLRELLDTGKISSDTKLVIDHSISTFGEEKRTAAIPLLKDLALLPNPFHNAITSIHKIGGEEAEKALKEIVETTTCKHIRNEALKTLKSMSPEAQQFAQDWEAKHMNQDDTT